MHVVSSVCLGYVSLQKSKNEKTPPNLIQCQNLMNCLLQYCDGVIFAFSSIYVVFLCV